MRTGRCSCGQGKPSNLSLISWEDAISESERLRPTTSVIAALMSLSNGICYRPGCGEPVVRFISSHPRVNLQIAHIYAAERGGPRYDEAMTDEERRAFANLLLLCKPCHDLVDIVELDQHTPEVLKRWKSDREALGMAGLRAIRGLTEDRLRELIAEALMINTNRPGEVPGGEALERDTALELQNELFKFGRAFGRAVHADEMTYKSTGVWGTNRLPQGLSDELLSSTVAINRLRVRLRDDELSRDFARYVELCTRAMIQNPATGTNEMRRARAQSLTAQATQLHGELNDRLGQKIRSQ
jgi:hypothetical protein